MYTCPRFGLVPGFWSLCVACPFPMPAYCALFSDVELRGHLCAQAVQNNGSVFVHAVFEATVQELQPALEWAEGEEPDDVSAGGGERIVQFTRTWRKLHSTFSTLKSNDCCIERTLSDFISVYYLRE